MRTVLDLDLDFFGWPPLHYQEGEENRPTESEFRHLSIWFAGRVHFPEQNRQVDGHWQLSKARTAKARRGSQIAEANISSDPADDRNTCPKEGSGEGRSSGTQAFAGGDDYGCLHARDSRKRARAIVNAISAELRKKAKPSRKQQTSSDLLPNATRKEGIRKLLIEWWTWSGSNPTTSSMP
jgi:hypothetical protein